MEKKKKTCILSIDILFGAATMENSLTAFNIIKHVPSTLLRHFIPTYFLRRNQSVDPLKDLLSNVIAVLPVIVKIFKANQNPIQVDEKCGP